jgi:DNA-nicking Smr family endonuclease
MAPIQYPIQDVLDLHTFRPSEVSDLLDDYFDLCLKRGITRVRIIHGKGTGQLKLRVRSILSRHPCVVSFNDAPARYGGWGATTVMLSEETVIKD